MIDTLATITYPALAAISLCSCIMRLFSYCYVRPSAKLLILAATNFFMFVAFALVSWAIQAPEWSVVIRPYRIVSWAVVGGFYALSVYMEWREALTAARFRQEK